MMVQSCLHGRKTQRWSCAHWTMQRCWNERRRPKTTRSYSDAKPTTMRRCFNAKRTHCWKLSCADEEGSAELLARDDGTALELRLLDAELAREADAEEDAALLTREQEALELRTTDDELAREADEEGAAELLARDEEGRYIMNVFFCCTRIVANSGEAERILVLYTGRSGYRGMELGSVGGQTHESKHIRYIKQGQRIRHKSQELASILLPPATANVVEQNEDYSDFERLHWDKHQHRPQFRPFPMDYRSLKRRRTREEQRAFTNIRRLPPSEQKRILIKHKDDLPYLREGGGYIYLTAQLPGDVVQGQRRKEIETELIVKWGETSRLTGRQEDYRRCEAGRVQMWIEAVHVERRLLVERLIHLELTARGYIRVIFVNPCGCGHRHREYVYLGAGSFADMESVMRQCLRERCVAKIYAPADEGLHMLGNDAEIE
ncbi:hypothetical protein R3P38DRAFT_2797684 [Favolaschia claudopus]|uniref:Bacteriophage T5 Orf172 DNA-binding domain-containing protein n=1 Tax=Favolaschia claudopus TaxID=2862362 RepID=A0AAW0A2Q8_9AGAR